MSLESNSSISLSHEALRDAAGTSNSKAPEGTVDLQRGRWRLTPQLPPAPQRVRRRRAYHVIERQYFRAKGSGLTLLGRLEERGLRPEAVHPGTCSAQSSAVLICVCLTLLLPMRIQITFAIHRLVFLNWLVITYCNPSKSIFPVISRVIRGHAQSENLE